VNPPEKAETSTAHECGRLSQIALVRVWEAHLSV